MRRNPDFGRILEAIPPCLAQTGPVVGMVVRFGCGVGLELDVSEHVAVELIDDADLIGHRHEPSGADPAVALSRDRGALCRGFRG